MPTLKGGASESWSPSVTKRATRLMAVARNLFRSAASGRHAELPAAIALGAGRP
jgi:hypothetical protein